MRWTKLKQRIEDTISEKLRDRVAFHTTRYRGAHDEAGELWITLDGQRIASYGELTWGRDLALQKEELEAEGHGIRAPYTLALDKVRERNIMDPYKVERDLRDYLNASLDQSLRHSNPVIRALALIDRRFGVRRLRDIDVSAEHPFVKAFYELRCEAEGVAARLELISS